MRPQSAGNGAAVLAALRRLPVLAPGAARMRADWHMVIAQPHLR